MSNWSRFPKGVIDAVLPQRCELCGGSSGAAPVCAACAAALPPVSACCMLCAVPLSGRGVCGRCLKRPPAFDATRAALVYAFPADRLVQALKYRHRLSLARYFSDLLRDSGPPDGVDCVVPMPMHPRGLSERGFNQAVEIARPLALAWSLPLLLDAVRRSRDGPPQASLEGAARRRNVRGAFEADAGRIAGRSVLVVDDVMTTGATLQALAHELKRAGAFRVENVVVARTP